VADKPLPRGDGRFLAFVLFLFFVAFYLLTASGRIDSGDGETVYQVTRSIVEGRGGAIPTPPPEERVHDPFGRELPPEEAIGLGGYGAWGRDGLYYGSTGLGHSLIALPLYLLGMWSRGLDAGFLTRFAVALLNPLVTAASCAALFALVCLLGFQRRVAIALALLYGVGTMAWPYAKGFFGEPLAALFLLLPAGALLRFRQSGNRPWLLVAGIGLAIAIVVKVNAVITLPAFALYLFVTQWTDGSGERIWSRWGDWLALLLPVFAGIGLVGAYNAIRFGSPLETGYGTAAWDTPPWVGLYGLLLSPGKGLIWYNPIVVAALAAAPAFYRQRRAEALFFNAIIGAYLLFHAAYNYWGGGGCWGPRLILPVISFIMLPLAGLLSRQRLHGGLQAGLALLIAVSVGLQVPAMGVNFARYYQKVYDESPELYYVRIYYAPRYSPLLGQWRSLVEVSGIWRDAAARARLRDLIERNRLHRQTASLSADELNQSSIYDIGILSVNMPDFWFIYLPFFGVDWRPIALVVAGLAGAAFWSGLFLARHARNGPAAKPIPD
jgi:hypothetical protein